MRFLGANWGVQKIGEREARETSFWLQRPKKIRGVQLCVGVETYTHRKWGSIFAVVESPRVFCNSGLLFDVAELKTPPVEDDSKTK